MQGATKMIKNLKRSRKLIIIAHPDDETFGCSGLLENSAIILVTDSDEANFAARTRILQRICKEKFIPLYKCGLQPCKLDTIGVQMVHNCIASAAKNIDAEIVLTHNPKDTHQDHRIISNAVDILARPERSQYKGLIHFSFEQHSHNLVVPSNTDLYTIYGGLVDSKFQSVVWKYKEFIGTKYGFRYGDTLDIRYLR